MASTAGLSVSRPPPPTPLPSQVLCCVLVFFALLLLLAGKLVVWTDGWTEGGGPQSFRRVRPERLHDPGLMGRMEKGEGEPPRFIRRISFPPPSPFERGDKSFSR